MSHATAVAPRISLEAWALLVALSLPWGGSFLFYRMLATELPPLTTVFGRLLIAGLALLVATLAQRRRLVVPWRAFLLLALLNNVVPFCLFAWAETRITGGTAAILNATTPILTTLVMRAAGAEALTTARLAGAALGFAGVAVLVGPDAAALSHDLPAEAACLGSALCYAFGALYGRRIHVPDALVAATAQTLCAALLLAPVWLLADQPWTLPMPNARAWTALLGIALLSTALAYVIYFRIMAVAGTSNLMLVTFLVPVSALALGAAFLQEPVGLGAIVGMVLIALGLGCIDGRLIRLLRRGMM
jgi:drug/metabolite transporter (DMT)-like permease